MTYLDWVKQQKEKQSAISYPEFAKTKYPELYREMLGENGYFLEVWQFKLNLKNAFSMGYRLKGSRKTKELLLQSAYRMVKNGELFTEKYKDQ